MASISKAVLRAPTSSVRTVASQHRTQGVWVSRWSRAYSQDTYTPPAIATSAPKQPVGTSVRTWLPQLPRFNMHGSDTIPDPNMRALVERTVGQPFSTAYLKAVAEFALPGTLAHVGPLTPIYAMRHSTAQRTWDSATGFSWYSRITAHNGYPVASSSSALERISPDAVRLKRSTLWVHPNCRTSGEFWRRMHVMELDWLQQISTSTASSIELHASSLPGDDEHHPPIGQYIWAAAGFDFTEPTRLNDYRTSFAAFLRRPDTVAALWQQLCHGTAVPETRACTWSALEAQVGHNTQASLRLAALTHLPTTWKTAQDIALSNVDGLTVPHYAYFSPTGSQQWYPVGKAFIWSGESWNGRMGIWDPISAATQRYVIAPLQQQKAS